LIAEFPLRRAHMTTSIPQELNRETIGLFHFRNRLLSVVREQHSSPGDLENNRFILQSCCNTIKEALDCTAWAGNIDPDKDTLVFISSSEESAPPILMQNTVLHHLLGRFGSNLATFSTPLKLELPGIGPPGNTASQLDMCWPIRFREYNFGFICLHFPDKKRVSDLQLRFVGDVIDDIGLAIFSQDTALKLKQERDFNKEIIDTIQALMVTIHPCGTIISFNRRAEEITGYTESEVAEKYWVDVLITPGDRKEFQQLFSEALKDTQSHINFMAPLLTKDGQVKQISWQGSIRHNIDQAKVGLVMIGIDETETLAVDQQLHRLTARWEKIFIAIQDPVLVVSRDNIILDANPATFSAAKKKRSEIIGKKVCEIFHGGHDRKNQCPLEQLMALGKTHITETELVGLHGVYMLTVTPLVEENGEINATLLVARNLTQEEVMRAESCRAAQLAALGELASGVAHEINNPINGIINYARIILDDPDDPETSEHLTNIVGEGKRIARIVSNLLDFARRRDEILSLSRLEKVVANSLELVSHLLKKDGILCTVDLDKSLPAFLCNEQQLQQVVLNLLSNARYALNKKYKTPCSEKRIAITGKLYKNEGKEMVKLSITDNGTGIADEIQDRLFDPFFSTKPKGEGTGLGLSISHGLVRDHGGFIKVTSSFGEWTRFSIHLPVRK
jgi:PAS domain S-box-containing protein